MVEGVADTVPSVPKRRFIPDRQNRPTRGRLTRAKHVPLARTAARINILLRTGLIKRRR